MDKSNVSNYQDDIYYKLYRMNERNASLLKEYSVYLDVKLEDFFEHVVNYINNNFPIPDYVNILNKLSTITESEQVIKYLDSISFDYKILRNNLMDYFINFRPDIYYTNENAKNRLKNNLQFYETHKAKSFIPSHCENENLNDNMNNIIIEYINSNYSISRFCYNKNLSKTLFKQYVAKIKTKNPELYNKFVEATNLKEQIKNEIIENDVYTILNIIKENSSISIIDFLLITNYDVFELVEVADRILSIEDKKLFRMNVKGIRYINRLSERGLGNLLNSTYTFNINGELIELSENDKIEIIKFLKENNIPVCNDTWTDACIKYLNNELKKGCSK